MAAGGYRGGAAQILATSSVLPPGGPVPDVSLVLVGPPGSGKSTLGNLLASGSGGGTGSSSRGPSPFIASDAFESSGAAVAHTDFEYENVSHRAIDTTGLFEGATNMADRLASCAILAPRGLDAFVFVIRKGRFTDELYHQLVAFEDAAGEGSLGRTVLAFTFLSRETNEQLKARCHASRNANLHRILGRVAAVVGVDSLLPARSADDRATILAATAGICRGHRDKPKPVPFDPKELRLMLDEMDRDVNELSADRRDSMKDKMDDLRSGMGSLAAVGNALREAREQQLRELRARDENAKLAGQADSANTEADNYRNFANAMQARQDGKDMPSGCFASCMPTSAACAPCKEPCAPCQDGLKDAVRDWQAERDRNIKDGFAGADAYADRMRQAER